MHAFLITGSTIPRRRDHALRLIAGRLGIAPGANHPDCLPISAPSITIDTIRQLKLWAARTPFSAPGKAVLIEEAHRLTLPAQQALLKTLEEPPPRTSLFLTCPNPDLLLPTIISRCRVINLPTAVETAAAGPIVSLLSNLHKMTPPQRLAAAQAYTGRAAAVALCSELLDWLRHRLYQGDTAPSANLELVEQARRRLEANVNPRLTIEQLFLQFT